MGEIIEARHWKEVDFDAWNARWPNFPPSELASKGDRSLKIDCEALDALQRVRDRIKAPMIVTSAYRDPAHNARVGGAKRSQHMEGRAFDIRMDNLDPADFIDVAEEEGFTGIGTYPDLGFVHIDTRPDGPARWGKAFPARVARFAPEPVARPAREVAKKALPAAAVIEFGRQALTEAAPALPVEWVNWGFAALALASLALMVWRAFFRDAEK